MKTLPISEDLLLSIFKFFERPSSLSEFMVIQAMLRREFPGEFRVKTFEELENK